MGRRYAGGDAALSSGPGMAVENNSRFPGADQTWIRPPPRSSAQSGKCHDDRAHGRSSSRSKEQRSIGSSRKSHAPTVISTPRCSSCSRAFTTEGSAPSASSGQALGTAGKMPALLAPRRNHHAVAASFFRVTGKRRRDWWPGAPSAWLHSMFPPQKKATVSASSLIA